MISLDMKNETTASSSSPLSLSTPNDEPTISFSELLRGVSEKKDGKVVQNGSLVLSLASDEKESVDTKGVSKADTLLSLLKNEDALTDKKEEPLELHPKITANLSTKELKSLVAQAKDYLKSKIQESDDFKKSQIKELPKTLKGLAAVAKKIGVDVTKITVEEVVAHSEPKVKKHLLKESDVKTLADKDVKEAVQYKKASTQETAEDIDVKSLVKDAVEDKKTSQKEEKAALKTEVKEEKAALKTEVKEEKATLKSEVKEDKAATRTEVKNDKAQSIEPKEAKKSSAISNDEVFKEIKRDEKIVQIPKEIKATPLFKAQTVAEHTTTEQIVQVKANSSLKVEVKTPKDKADETLKLLLRGEKPSVSNPTLTADFSVATAKVIAPRATSETTKSLEALLHGEPSSDTATKTEALTTHKADSFEVKLNEAKQMIKYLSSDVKSAIEDYKSPFTRVKVQLNPQKLGDVDLTVVQRGKNLHVNISSNNTAVNTLAMNANELRVQLSNNGINNATLNFNNSSQNGDSGAGQQQQNRQNEQNAREEYNYFDNEEANEEVLNSLEIIVPQYG